DGILYNSGYQRYSGRINYERNLSDALKVNVNAFGSHSRETSLIGAAYGAVAVGNAWSTLLQAAPVVPIRNADGSFNDVNSYLTTPTNPLQDILQTTNTGNFNRL